MNYNPSISRHMLAMLSAVINKKAIYIMPDKIDWETLYSLASYHEVENTLHYRIIGSTASLPEDTQNRFFRSFQQAVSLDHQQNQELNKIIPLLEEIGGAAVLLQGFMIKYFYPHMDMRYTEQLEFLIEPQMERAVHKLMLKLGYERENFLGIKAMVFHKQLVGRVFFHTSLESSSQKMQKYLSSLQKRTYVKEGYTSIYEMKWEDFYLYMICDMANSFALQKLDVRNIMDVWMFERKFREGLDWTYINMELKSMDLYLFECYIRRLSQLWFAENVKDELEINENVQDSICLDLEQYVLTKGIEGFESCKFILPLVDEIGLWSKKETRRVERRRLRCWLFPDYHYMCSIYPIVEKLPAACMPLFWLRRFLAMGFGKIGKRLNRWLEPLFSKIHSLIFFLLPKHKREQEEAQISQAVQEENKKNQEITQQTLEDEQNWKPQDVAQGAESELLQDEAAQTTDAQIDAQTDTQTTDAQTEAQIDEQTDESRPLQTEIGGMAGEPELLHTETEIAERRAARSTTD